MTRLVFLDTETTGLLLNDHIWEIAAIVRDPGAPDVEYRWFVQHDLDRAARLPDDFRADHDARYRADEALTPADAAQRIYSMTRDRAHIVGAVPNFDTERLARMMRRHGIEPGWHHHLTDVENLAIGYLAANGHALTLPWDSIALTTALGVPAPEDRHTALADARWARDTYDAVMRGGRVGLVEIQSHGDPSVATEKVEMRIDGRGWIAVDSVTVTYGLSLEGWPGQRGWGRGYEIDRSGRARRVHDGRD